MNVKDEFCSALIRRANDFIKFPKTEAETRQAMQEFLNISRFPQVVGALDGSHIPIKAPKDDPNEYVNRKVSIALFCKESLMPMASFYT